MKDRDNMSPEYSVIVPVYNVEDVLDRCIESVLVQTYKDFELLLIDDGSNDQSLQICLRYAALDNRVRVVHQDNSGVSAARNKGLSKAKGKYIVFIDSDDYVDEDYLSSFCDIDGDLVIDSFIIEDEEKNVINYVQTQFDMIRLNDIEKCNKFIEESICVFAKRFKKSIIDENRIIFEESINLGEDTCFVVDYMQYIDCIIMRPACTYHYVRYTEKETLSNQAINSLSIDKYELFLQYLYKKLIDLLGDSARAKSLISRRCGKMYQTYVNLYLHGDTRVSKETIRHIINQYWYKLSLKDSKLFEKDSSLHQLIIRLNNYRILELYRRYLMIKMVKHERR